MFPFRKDTLEALMARREAPSVSLFMPTHRAGPDVRQNALRCRNLIRQAEDRLVERGLRRPDAKTLLQPSQRLLDDDAFWQHQQGGLAVFLAPGFSRWYVVPLHVDERVVISGRFHVRPLLPLLSGDGRFYLLALSQNAVRLLEGTRHRVAEVDLERVPTSLAEALRFDEPEEQLQFRVGIQTGTGAVFHGHGVGNDDAKERIQRYFQQVDRGLRDVLREEHAPLVLAGVEYLLPIYRDANTYSHLLADAVTGNPEGLRAEELHEQAWQIVGPHFEAQQHEAAATYRRLAGTGLSSRDLREVVPAAFHGRVDRLFVSTDRQVWGRFDQATTALHVGDGSRPGEEELLDLAAIHTILAGGVVFAVEQSRMPEESDVAAVFRY